MLEHRRVAGLTCGEEHDQWAAAPIDQVMSLGRQAVTRPTDGVVSRLDPRIRSTPHLRGG